MFCRRKPVEFGSGNAEVGNFWESNYRKFLSFELALYRASIAFHLHTKTFTLCLLSFNRLPYTLRLIPYSISHHFPPCPMRSALCVFYSESPLAMHIRRMGIWRCKQAFDLYAVIYFLCKGGEFGPVHFFAVILGQSSSGSCHLGRA